MSNLAEQLAETVTKSGISSAYGEAVDLDGTTIMPVAVVSYGFGAGEGTLEGPNAGEGGGGGGMSLPIGAYVTRDGQTRFEPNLIALIAVGIPFVCVAGRALSRVIRALKR